MKSWLLRSFLRTTIWLVFRRYRIRRISQAGKCFDCTILRREPFIFLVNILPGLSVSNLCLNKMAELVSRFKSENSMNMQHCPLIQHPLSLCLDIANLWRGVNLAGKCNGFDIAYERKYCYQDLISLKLYRHRPYGLL